jgi:hypothetical protein
MLHWVFHSLWSLFSPCAFLRITQSEFIVENPW